MKSPLACTSGLARPSTDARQPGCQLSDNTTSCLDWTVVCTRNLARPVHDDGHGARFSTSEVKRLENEGNGPDIDQLGVPFHDRTCYAGGCQIGPTSCTRLSGFIESSDLYAEM